MSAERQATLLCYCGSPADTGEYCPDHYWDHMAECDCCGKHWPKESMSWVYPDSVGETYACPRCHGWTDAEITELQAGQEES